MNSIIRRAVVSVAAAGALAGAGSGVALADEASFEENSQGEVATADRDGAEAASFEESTSSESSTGNGGEESQDSQDEGVLGLGILGL